MPKPRRHLPLAAMVSLACATPSMAEDVLVFAAASMRTALERVAADWMAETGHIVTISYAGSNQLAQQIIAGAPADIFISAAVSWMDAVEDAGLVVEGTRGDLLGNQLVLIGHGPPAERVEITPDLDLAAMLGDERLAMALVDAVPAGQYGKAALESLGLWYSVEGLVAQADNVRAALALVSTGEAPYGIVYATDAAADETVTILGTFPPESHPLIRYPAALLAEAADDADRAFFAALRSDSARAAFEAEGFTVLD
ncbi:molybdate ABC transporter substrate-binding protein [Roseicyclus marinus]|uniref:molybdate ABC transporter substrate-binding protein n=1 Tax=Roseicyclus marinus TaxID=2161673 RepID=UPI00240EB126|nr:molybdate ABC transporter substrate-binding protein [Roseicyclus marinus]MDG3039964.1 molybdate ABC transporter substrate-binding protein [Roseicyclus marinus]